MTDRIAQITVHKTVNDAVWNYKIVGNIPRKFTQELNKLGSIGYFGTGINLSFYSSRKQSVDQILARIHISDHGPIKEL